MSVNMRSKSINLLQKNVLIAYLIFLMVLKETITLRLIVVINQNLELMLVLFVNVWNMNLTKRF